MNKIILLGVGLVAGFAIYDIAAGYYRTYTGTVVDKSFVPGSSSSGSGYGTTASGKTVYIHTTQSSSDDWKLMIEDSGGKVEAIETEATQFYHYKVGDRVQCRVYIGKITGMPYLRSVD